MTRVFRATLLTACALLSLSAAIAQEYTLKLNVKEGDTFKYRMSMEIDFGGQNLLATTTITNKVLKVEENGNIQMESASGEMVIKFGDQEMPQPAPPATKMTFKPNGSVAKVDGGDAMMQQMNASQMVYPEKPVKVGDKWSETVKNPNGELAIEYELVGVEKVGDTEAVKIKMTARTVNAKEGEGYSADGFTWVDPKTGMAIKMEDSHQGHAVQGSANAYRRYYEDGTGEVILCCLAIHAQRGASLPLLRVRYNPSAMATQPAGMFRYNTDSAYSKSA